MKVSKYLAGAALAVLASGSLAWAGDTSSSLTQNGSATASQSGSIVTPILADDAAAAAKPAIMDALDRSGIGTPLDNANINIYGFVEGGYLYDLNAPNDLRPDKSAPTNSILFAGDYKNAPMLNQLDLTVERTVDATKGKFDVGFRVEGIWGRDAYYIHSNGILDETNKGAGFGPLAPGQGAGPDDQLDLNQAYVTVAIPVGAGLTIKAGKFVTLMSEEVINPTGNAFYTHSYNFSYGVAATNTGVLASYNPSDKLALTAGITRGPNQTLYDVNGDPDFMGEFTYTFTDKFSLIGNMEIGPEAAGDVAHWWDQGELIPTYKVSDQLTVAGDFLYTLANAYSQWYGAVAYAGYTVNKYATLNFRGEVYHDGKDFTTGGLISPRIGTDVNYYEGTAGVAITPVPDMEWFNSLTIRPELRVDWADHSVFDNVNPNAVDFAMDVYWKF